LHILDMATPLPIAAREKGRANAPAFDPEAYSQRLDPAHEALAPLNLSAETLKAFKSGYAATGSNRGAWRCASMIVMGRSPASSAAP
jgi:hypothetical protein